MFLRFGNTAPSLRVLLSVALATPLTGFAQDDANTEIDTIVLPQEELDTPESYDSGAVALDSIQVTGSRISRTDYETAQPVSILAREDIERSGLTNIGDLLQDLPAAGSALNRTFNNGGSGEVNIDLRNLGSERVLVLVDGRRWVPGASGFSNAVDLNTIPVSIIERVEVLKDGASAIYGSDAITGVVNVITRRDFDGVELNAQYGIFEQGDGAQSQVNASWGNVTDNTTMFFDANFVRQEQVSSGDRVLSAEPLWGTGLTRGSVFTPQGTVLMIPTADNGTILGSELCPEILVGPTVEDETGLSLPFNLGSAGLQLCDMVLAPGQTVSGNETTAQVASRYVPRNGTSLGDDNMNYNYQPINYLLTPFEQSSIFTQISHQFLDNVGFTGRAFYTKHKTERQLAETPLLFGDLLFPPYNSVYIAANQIHNPFNQDIGRHPGQGTDADELGLGPGTGLVARRFVEAGPRFLSRTTQTLFLSGAFNGDFLFMDRFLNWDAGYANGSIVNNNIHRGDLNMDHVKLALGPSEDCDADPACVPLNLFGGQGADGQGTITQDQLDYVTYNGTSSADGGLQYAWAGISGETSDFGFMAAPLGVAVGVEYREEEFSNEPDALVQAGISSTNIQRATSGKTSVKEAFIELDAPLLSDLPGVQELGLNLAGRYSAYDRFDAATTGKAGLRWKPINDLLVRGTWSQAFRAPSVIDLFLGTVDSYPSLSDPCVDPANDVESENCGAEGGTGAQQLGSQILTKFGGNPDLEPETAESWTAGLVYNPAFLPDFSMTVDWYSIDTDGFIDFLDPQFILDSCYSNEWSGGRPETCNFVSRNSSGSIENIDAVAFNFSSVKTSGLEVAFNYRQDLGAGLGALDFGFDSSYLAEYKQATPNADGSSTQQSFAGRNDGHTTYPRLKFNASLGWTVGQWQASWTARFIYRTIEKCDDGLSPALGSIEGVCSDPNIFTETAADGSEVTVDKSMNELPTTIYHNLQVSYHVPGWDTTVVLGSINVLDQDPPISYSVGAGNNSFPNASFEVPGRQLYMKLSKRF